MTFAFNLSTEKKYDLIRQYPVTYVRYFEHRLRCLWEILSASCGPFQGYESEDKYLRVEFQVRGSPHIHALLWLKMHQNTIGIIRNQLKNV